VRFLWRHAQQAQHPLGYGVCRRDAVDGAVVAEQPDQAEQGAARASLATLDGMLAAYERVIATGFHMQWNVGQHTNDRELSFYCVTPSGFEWELGWNPIVVTPDLEQTWAPKTYDGISIWGHTPIAVSGRGTCRTTDRSPIVMHNLVHNCPLSRTTRARPNELALFGTAR